MLPYNIYDVGTFHTEWEVRESADIVTYSTLSNEIFRGRAELRDLVATILKGHGHGHKKRWKITLLEGAVILPFKIVNEDVFEFEHRNIKYAWKKEEPRNWNLTDEKGMLIAQFDKCKWALTKVGELYFTGKGDWLEREIVVATIKAVQMYLTEG